jgi:hypothetical protein
MKTKFYLILACIAASLTVSAKQISADQAIARFKAESNAPAAAKAANAKSIETIFTTDKSAALYLVNSGETTIVLSADDQVKPLLGYFDAPVSGEMPEQLQNWLSEYARQIAFIRTQPQCTYQAKVREKDYEPIAPLVSSTWGEGEPFSNLLPEVDGSKAAPGPVALDYAMVMHYFKYPQKPSGSVSYYDEGTFREMDFSEQDFDWDNMLDDYSGDYTDAQANAVAYLCKACAYAARTKFSSSASYENIPLDIMVNDFGYSDKATMLFRDYLDFDTWENLVYENLKTVGPLPYGGENTTHGFGFVCDGYDKDGYFHFNWGRDGNYNGYFQLDALNIYGTNQHGAAYALAYTLNQDAIFNFAPAGHETIELPELSNTIWGGNLVATLTDENTVTLTRELPSYYDYALYNIGYNTHQFEFALKAYNPTTDETKILNEDCTLTYSLGLFGHAEYNYYGLPNGLSSIELEYLAGLSLDAGTYVLSPVTRVKDSDKWLDVQRHNGCTTSFFATVDSLGNIVSVKNSTPTALTIDELALDSKLILSRQFFYTFSVTNNSDDDVTGIYTPYIIVYDKIEGQFKFIANGEKTIVCVRPGDTQHHTFLNDITITDEDYADYEGQAYLTLKNGLTGELSELVPITIEGAITKNAGIKSDGVNVEIETGDTTTLNISFTTVCYSGYYIGTFYIFIDNAEGETVSLFETDDTYCFSKGDTITVNTSCRFDDYTPGATYTVYPCLLAYDYSYCYFYFYSDFTMPGETTSIAAVKANNAISIKANRGEGTISVAAPSEIASVEGFALDGRKVNLDADVSGTAAQAVLPNGLTIIKVTLTDGTTAIRKVVR